MWTGQKTSRSNTLTPSNREPAAPGDVVTCRSVRTEPKPRTPGKRKRPLSGLESDHSTPLAVHDIGNLDHAGGEGAGGKYGVP
jgi:hypothetical protein